MLFCELFPAVWVRSCSLAHGLDFWIGSRRSAAEQSDDDRLGRETRRPGNSGSCSRPCPTPCEVPAGANAFPLRRAHSARTATRPQTGRGLRISGKYLLAPKRSRGSCSLSVSGVEPESARQGTAALSLDKRFTLRSDRREQTFRRDGGHAARTRILSGEPDARTGGAIHKGTSGTKSRDLRSVHNRALASVKAGGCSFPHCLSRLFGASCESFARGGSAQQRCGLREVSSTAG